MNEQTLFAHRDSGHLPAELKITDRAGSYSIEFRNEGGGGSDPQWESVAFDRTVIASMVSALTAHLESLPPTGTFKCPICAVDSIHTHSGEEVAEYRRAAGAPAETPKPDIFGDQWHSLTCDGTCSPPCKDANPAATIRAGEGKDAARYRFLRDNGVPSADGCEDEALLVYKGFGESSLLPDQLDAAIDAAMRSKTLPGEAG